MQNKKRARFLLTSLQGGKRIGLRLALGAAITFSIGAMNAANYELTIVASTGDTIGGKTLIPPGISDFPAINNSGEVIFQGYFSGGSGMFSLSQLLVKTGDTIGGITLNGMFGPDVNER